MMMLNMWMMQAKMKLREFCKKEDGDVNVVSIVVLIGVAVLLAIIFRGAISNLLKSLFNTIEQNANNAITNERNRRALAQPILWLCKCLHPTL